MGLALSCQNRYDAAIEAYKKAIELDPNNDSYKSNLAIAEEKVREANQRFQNNPGAVSDSSFLSPCKTILFFQNPFGGLGGLLGGLGGGGPGGAPDLSALMNNPQMMNAAMQMMNDPNMQNLMGSMMEQFMGGSAGGAAAPGAGGNFADLLAAGQSVCLFPSIFFTVFLKLLTFRWLNKCKAPILNWLNNFDNNLLVPPRMTQTKVLIPPIMIQTTLITNNIRSLLVHCDFIPF